MKLAPLWRKFNEHPMFEPVVVHTGQHYDYEMSQVFFEDLELPEPDFYLGVGSNTHAKQTAEIMIRLEEILGKEKPDLVIVFGDVNSTLAAAVVTSKLQIKLAHVEAGLRSFRRSMPEEINRLVTDVLSNYLFTTDEFANKNLLKEGIPEERIYMVGNIMIDSLRIMLDKIKEMEGSILEKHGLTTKNYALLTLHRPINVDHREKLEELVGTFDEIAHKIEVVFPIHPRTRNNMEKWELEFRKVRVINPLSYRDFIILQKNALFVMTDSGGVQEESTILGVPCLTIRPETERPITVKVGTNTVVGNSRENILKHVNLILEGKYKKGTSPPLWDGHTAERIVKVFEKNFLFLRELFTYRFTDYRYPHYHMHSVL